VTGDEVVCGVEKGGAVKLETPKPCYEQNVVLSSANPDAAKQDNVNHIWSSSRYKPEDWICGIETGPIGQRSCLMMD
jgi:hypothetical protein